MRPGVWGLMPGSTGASSCEMYLSLLSLSGGVSTPTILAPTYALIWAAIGLVYMLLVKGREPASDALADLRT